VSDTSRAGITNSAADLLRLHSRSAAVQAEIIRYGHQGYQNRQPTSGLREFSDGAHKPGNIALK